MGQAISCLSLRLPNKIVLTFHLRSQRKGWEMDQIRRTNPGFKVIVALTASKNTNMRDRTKRSKAKDEGKGTRTMWQSWRAGFPRCSEPVFLQKTKGEYSYLINTKVQ